MSTFIIYKINFSPVLELPKSVGSCEFLRVLTGILEKRSSMVRYFLENGGLTALRDFLPGIISYR